MNNKRKYTIPNKCYDQELTIITKRNMCENNIHRCKVQP